MRYETEVYCGICKKDVVVDRRDVAQSGTDESYTGYFCPICNREFFDIENECNEQ